MRYFPEGFYAALGLQMAALWDLHAAGVRPVASTAVDLCAIFPKPRWADAPCSGCPAPRAIVFDWSEPPARH